MYRDMTGGGITRSLLLFALPMMAGSLLQQLYNVADTLIVGRALGRDALAAVGSAFTLTTFLTSVFLGLAMGAGALFAICIGRGDMAALRRAAALALCLIGAVTAVLTALVYALLSPILRFLQVPETLRGDMAGYLRIIFVGLAATFLYNFFACLLRAAGNSAAPLWFLGGAALLNVGLDLLFVLVFHWGIAGAAWATVIGQCLGAVVAVILNHCKNPEIHLRLRHIRPSGKLMGEITAISIPSIIMSCISSLTCFVMNLILITFSSTAVAVFGVYFKLQSFVFMPVFGLNNGMVPIIAYNYGAQKPERIHKTIHLGMLYAVIIMVLGFLVFQLIPKELLLMFDASDAMLEIGAPALRIMSLAFIFAGISIVAGSSCQAFGYSVYSMLISIARQIVVLIPAAYLLSLTGVLRSIWFAFPIAEIFSLILSLFFLRTTLKKTGMAMPKTK